MQDFGKRLTAVREKQKLSPAELSNKLHISTERLSFWEKGEREPGLTMLKKICTVLKVSPSFLLGLSEEN